MQILNKTMVGRLRFKQACRFLFCLLAGVLVMPAFAQEAEEQGDAAESATSQSAIVPGSKSKPRASPADLAARMRLSFDFRQQGDYKDTDVYGYVYVNGKNMNAGRLDVYTSARLHTDFDDEASSFSEDPYKSLDDAKVVTEQRLLQLYADLHTQDKTISLRGGRQYVEIADYLHLDGGQLALYEQEALGGRIYAGQPVSFYSTTDGDLAGGVSLVGKPWEGNRSRLTLARYYEESRDDSDHNYFGDIRQKFSDYTRVRGQGSLLNDEFRMARLDLFYTSESGETDLSMGSSYWGEFDANTRAYSPLYDTLGTSHPYTYTHARLTQLLVPTLYVSPGVSLKLADSGDNPYRNRDYQNFDLTFIYEPDDAFDVSLALEHWNVEESDSFFGLSGEIRYKYLRKAEVAGGVSFAEYTYDTYSDINYTASGDQAVIQENGTLVEENPFVQTYYLRGRWKCTKHLALRLQFDVEDDDVADDLAYRGRGSVEVTY